jgi:hypothetical protein
VSPYQLACSLWPRTGADRRHSRRVDVIGPRAGRVVHRVELAVPPSRQTLGGIGVAGDGSLRVATAGLLWHLGADGAERWRASISGASPDEAEAHSAPAVLADGSAVVSSGRRIVVIAASGDVSARIALDLALDDSGSAPNVTADGALLLSCPTGTVLTLDGAGAVQELGAFGYDVTIPAIADDGSLVIAGYARAGLVRVARDGRVTWRSGFKDADMVPTVRPSNAIACGSRNDRQVRFYAPDGTLAGSYPAAAAVGEASGDEWFLVASDHVARVDAAGQAVWTRQVGETGVSWGALGPAIDREDACVVPTQAGLACLDRQGNVIFELPLDQPISDLAIVAEGTAAALARGTLLIVQ